MPRSLIPHALGICLLVAGGAAAPNESSAQTLRPLVHIESDPDGTRYIHVMEPSATPLTPAETIANRNASPRINIRNALATLVRDVTFRDAKYGIHVRGAGPIFIENVAFIDWHSDDIHGAAVKVHRSAPAPTYIRGLFADAGESPDSSYERSNTDFIGIERNAGPVYVRYATGRNFGDAGIDAKSDVALMNVTIDGAHRGLRVWNGATLTIANAIVNVPPGHEQVWMRRDTSRLRYYNVLWCVGSTNPAHGDPACTTQPTAIGVDGITEDQARSQITALRSNPLTENPFFATRIDSLVVEYSANGGDTWRVMATAGAAGRPPYGDLRYRIPFDLSRGAHLFRVQFQRNGERVGAPLIVDETGRVV